MPGEPLQPLPSPSALQSAGRAAAASLAVAAGLFCVVVGALLSLNQARLAASDPLNAPALTELRRQYVVTPGDEALKARIRQEDARARQGYFAWQDRAGTGARLLVAGALALLAGLAALSLFRADAPDVAGFGPPPSEWDRRRAAGRGLAVGALVLLAAAALAAGLSRREESPLNLNPNPPETVNKQDYDYDYDPVALQFCHAPPRAPIPEPGAR